MTSSPVIVRAPGKLFLAGEWAVLHGAPALVVAVDRFAEVSVLLRPGGDLVVDSRLEGETRLTATDPAPGGDAGVVLAAWQVVADLEPRLAAGGAYVRVDTRAFFEGGQKLGLGRSAAALSAAVVALLTAGGLAVDPLAVAVAAHARFQGGHGSGADVAAAIHGGVVEVTREPQGLAVARRALPAGLELVIGWTGAGAATEPLLRRFAQLDAPAALGALAGAARSAAAAVARDDAARFRSAVVDAARGLAALGDETGLPIVTPALARLVAAAERVGAVAKPSGAGGGDCGVAFADSRAQAARVRAVWIAEGIVPLAVAPSVAGAHLVPVPVAAGEGSHA